jgi:hypothetical protein
MVSGRFVFAMGRFAILAKKKIEAFLARVIRLDIPVIIAADLATTFPNHNSRGVRCRFTNNLI